jgi:hypothetical protein
MGWCRVAGRLSLNSRVRESPSVLKNLQKALIQDNQQQLDTSQQKRRQQIRQTKTKIQTNQEQHQTPIVFHKYFILKKSHFKTVFPLKRTFCFAF